MREIWSSYDRLNRRFVFDNSLAFNSLLVSESEQSVFSADIEQHDHGFLSQNKCTELFTSAAFLFFIIYLFIFCGAELFSFAAFLSQNKCTKLFSE